MRRRSLTYTIHGVDALNKRVLATVFARKLTALVAGLQAADKDGNGGSRFDYVISDLGVSSAVVKLDAFEKSAKPAKINPIDAFEECVNALSKSNFDKALEYGETVSKIASLSNGAGKDYAYADLAVGDNVIRIDDFISRQAENARLHKEAADDMLRYFAGVAWSTFDGEIKEVDLRGSIRQMKLVLSVGGKEIDCISRSLSVDEIRAALDNRVVVEGEAIFGGRTGLPERIEISRVTVIGKGGDAARWRGTFHPFDISGWGDEA